MSNAHKMIRLHRRARGISQIEMSKRLKVSQSIVSRIETGKHRLTPDYVRRICAALGIRAAALTRAPQVN